MLAARGVDQSVNGVVGVFCTRFDFLVVEEDPTLRLVIQDNLGSEGYEVDVAADGACAVSQTRAALRTTDGPDVAVTSS